MFWIVWFANHTVGAHFLSAYTALVVRDSCCCCVLCGAPTCVLSWQCYSGLSPTFSYLLHDCIYSPLNFHLKICVCVNVFFRYASKLVFLAVAVACLHWLTGYLGLALVFGWNNAQQEKINFYFSRVFCWY